MINDDVKTEVLNLRREGKTYNQIHEITGVAKSSISDICRKEGLGTDVTVVELTDELIKKAQELYDQLGSVKKVAKLLGVGTQRLSKVITIKSIRQVTKSQAVVDWRKRTKLKLIEYKGGKCEICGYNKCIAALEFHHLDPNEKDFTISGSSKSFEHLKEEVDKCILVCANCHRELHYKE